LLEKHQQPKQPRNALQSMPPSVASTRASSRRDKHRPGIVKCQVTDPSKFVADARDVHVVFRIKTRATAREFVLQCRSELRDGHATFDVGRRYQDFVMYVFCVVFSLRERARCGVLCVQRRCLANDFFELDYANSATLAPNARQSMTDVRASTLFHAGFVIDCASLTRESSFHHFPRRQSWRARTCGTCNSTATSASTAASTW
jgi:hypothetical protein